MDLLSCVNLNSFLSTQCHNFSKINNSYKKVVIVCCMREIIRMNRFTDAH